MCVILCDAYITSGQQTSPRLTTALTAPSCNGMALSKRRARGTEVSLKINTFLS